MKRPHLSGFFVCKTMKIVIKAKPAASEDKVEKIDNEYVVSVKAPPVRGLANAAIVKLLADYFKVSASSVRIISGYTARIKVIEIID